MFVPQYINKTWSEFVAVLLQGVLLLGDGWLSYISLPPANADLIRTTKRFQQGLKAAINLLMGYFPQEPLISSVER